MGIGPLGAVAKLFIRTGLSWRDIRLVELSQSLRDPGSACTLRLGLE